MTGGTAGPLDAVDENGGLVAGVRRRLDGDFDVDEWGLDPDLVHLVNPLLAARWRIDVRGADHLPVVGPSVLVFNRRFGVSEPWVLARGIRISGGRFVRTIGIPDVAPVGGALRRMGGVLDRPDEISGLLRAGQLVGLPMDREVRPRPRAGLVTVASLEPSLATHAPVLPVALVGRECGRRWRVLVGEPVAPPSGEGPLAAAELAESTRRSVQALLDEAARPLFSFG
ncbi:MAG: hypothetical protein JWM05_3061 [Acidimicrobiales bacterium]|nr:hypothetical protein [Acidimicrobiales bacterium]